MRKPWGAVVSLVLGGVVTGAAPAAVGAQGGQQPSVTIIQPASVALRRLQPVGRLDGASMDVGRIVGVVADATGAIVLADGQAQQLLVFGADGRFVRRIGRRGPGPGEMASLHGLGIMGDTLIAFDPKRGQAHFFSISGQFLMSSQAVPRELGTPAELHVSRDVVSIAVLKYPKAVEVTAGRAWIGPPERGYVRVTQWGALQPLAGAVTSDPVPPGLDCESRRGVVHVLPAIFGGGGPLQTFLEPSLLATASRTEYQVQLRPVSGGPRPTTLVRHHEPVRVTDQRWAVESAPYRRIAEREGSLTCYGDRGRETAYARPARLPVARTLVTDDHGRLWLEVFSAAGFEYHVIERTGKLIAQIAGPARDASVPPFVRNGRLYSVAVDGDGLQSVEVYQIGALRSGQ